MKYGVAPYGMSQWDGGCFDLEQRAKDLKGIGYEGIESIGPVSEADCLSKAAMLHRLGMDFAWVGGSTIETSIQWTAAMGKEYVWTKVLHNDFDRFCREVNTQIEHCERWGIKVGLHNHLGTPVESQPQLEEFLSRCPKAWLILDTAHLAAADGDPVEIVKKYGDRIVSMHLKDWLLTNPEIGLDKWWTRGRFCELGAGNIGMDNIAVMRALVESGYDGWVFVEHDTHLRDPLLDLAHSLNYLREAGF